MPVDFSQQAALRREQCDMIPKSQNLGIRSVAEVSIVS
jgi:hypothetical protein